MINNLHCIVEYHDIADYSKNTILIKILRTPVEVFFKRELLNKSRSKSHALLRALSLFSSFYGISLVLTYWKNIQIHMRINICSSLLTPVPIATGNGNSSTSFVHSQVIIVFEYRKTIMKTFIMT